MNWLKLKPRTAGLFLWPRRFATIPRNFEQGAGMLVVTAIVVVAVVVWFAAR